MPKRQGSDGQDLDADPDRMRGPTESVSHQDLGQLSNPEAEAARPAAPSQHDQFAFEEIEPSDSGLEDGIDAIEFMILAFGFDDLDMVRSKGEIPNAPGKLNLHVVATPTRH